MVLLYVFLIIIPFLAIAAVLTTEKGKQIKEYIHFFLAGLESGFKIPQIMLLGKIGRTSGLEDLSRLFWSIPDLDNCTAEIIRKAKQKNTYNDAETQLLLTKLYNWRTRTELEQSHRKRGLETTRDIIIGQRVRILLRGVGVFSSKVIRNTSKELLLEFPVGTNTAATSIDWKNQQLGIYLWRHNDAGYVFDTVVLSDPHATGKAVLQIAHSRDLVRSQKRRSVRAKCSIYAQLYLVKPGSPLDYALEPEPGMKCLIEDISEDGAMILIGGKAVKNVQIKLQFMLQDVLIVMAGVIRGAEFNIDTNQSRIHFETGELNQRMRNAILSFVYNILPQNEREELDAIRLSEEDDLGDKNNPDSVTKRNPIDDINELVDLPDFTDKKL